MILTKLRVHPKQPTRKFTPTLITNHFAKENTNC